MTITIGDEIRKITERYETELAEARARLATARNDALEEAAEAARTIEDNAYGKIRGEWNPYAISKAIRALKTEPKP